MAATIHCSLRSASSPGDIIDRLAGTGAARVTDSMQPMARLAPHIALALLCGLACSSPGSASHDREVRKRAAAMSWTDAPGTEPADEKRRNLLQGALAAQSESYE